MTRRLSLVGSLKGTAAPHGLNLVFRFLTIKSAEQDISLMGPLLTDLSCCSTIYSPSYYHGCPGIFIAVPPSDGLSNALKFGPNC